MTEKVVPRQQTLDRLLEHLKASGSALDPDTVRLGLGVFGFATEIVAAAEAHFARYGLSQGRFGVLMMLFVLDEEIWTPARLADSAGVSRATLTGLLDVLVRGGWVVRRPHPEDGRMTVVRLTAEGHKRISGILPDHAARISAAMAAVDTTEADELLRLLATIAPAFQRLRES